MEGALLRTALTFFSPTLIEEDFLKLDRQPTLNRSQTAGPSDIYRAKDGWITVAVNGDPLFRRVARLIGAPEWLDDPRFASDKARGDNGEIISERVGAWVSEKTSAEAIAAFEGARVPAGPVYRPRETLDDTHIAGGDFFASVNFPGIGDAKVNRPRRSNSTKRLAKSACAHRCWASTPILCCANSDSHLPKSTH